MQCQMLCCTIPAGHICIVFHLLFLFITYVGYFEMISNVTEKLLKSCAVLSYGSAPALKYHHQSSLSSLRSPPSELDSTRSNSPNLSFKSPSEICRFNWISQLFYTVSWKRQTSCMYKRHQLRLLCQNMDLQILNCEPDKPQASMK